MRLRSRPGRPARDRASTPTGVRREVVAGRPDPADWPVAHRAPRVAPPPMA